MEQFLALHMTSEEPHCIWPATVSYIQDPKYQDYVNVLKRQQR